MDRCSPSSTPEGLKSCLKGSPSTSSSMSPMTPRWDFDFEDNSGVGAAVRESVQIKLQFGSPESVCDGGKEPSQDAAVPLSTTHKIVVFKPSATPAVQAETNEMS